VAGEGERSAPAPSAAHDFKGSSYEIFVLALSLLSLTNMILYFLPIEDDVRYVITVVDVCLSLVFLPDFLYRLLTTESKSNYFLRRGGWLDLIGSLPFPGLRAARLFRVIRAIHLLREVGGRRVLQAFLSEKGAGTFLLVVFLVVLVLEFASISVLAAERGAADTNITSGGNALWWTFVTVTTVGYGDYYPVTGWGRIVGVITMTIGVGLFGTFTAFVANIFLGTRKAKPTAAEADVPSRLREIEDALAEQEERSASLRAALGDVRQAL
jgi:voltage-gated potassium channel